MKTKTFAQDLINQPQVEISHFDSARQSQIEALRSKRGTSSRKGKGDEEDRFGKAAASQNEKFQLEAGLKRPRRNRKSVAIRALLEETRLHPHDFIAPLFVVEGRGQKQPISSMPGVFRFSLDLLSQEVNEMHALGIQAVNLFPVIPAERKNPFGSEAIRLGNLMQETITDLKEKTPDMCVMVDIALDPYTDHGHDGLIDETGYVLNDDTVEVLAEMSLRAAEAGADFVSPSDMMDGRVNYIRKVLDQAGFAHVGIMSYAVKYASAFYGPFREALDSAPKIGNKKGYQLNPANVREALQEVILDDQEGADMLLIKPALPYLDVITKARECTHLPLGAYHVSGEYAMIMAAAQNQWLNADQALKECLLSIKRAGADFIVTYAAKRMAELLQC